MTLDPATGHVAFETPEQFADEALALPAPEPEVSEEPVAETPAAAEPEKA